MSQQSQLDRARLAFGLELPDLLRLAGPVVLAELSWHTMQIVDTMMVGRVSAEAIGAVSIGGSLFFPVALFGIGMLLGLDYLVAHAFGSGDIHDAHRWLVHGVFLSLLLTAVLTAAIRLAIPHLHVLGVEPRVLDLAIPYLKAVSWSLLPLLLFAALRRYLQAMGLVKPILATAVIANLVNAAGCWVLIFGHLGAPAMGAEGAGWATGFSRGFMFLCLLAFALRHDRRNHSGLGAVERRIDLARLRQLATLGLPAAIHITLEVGVFAAATMLAGRLDASSLAAHQIALSAAGLTFMVPLGIASSGAVRVGQELGRGDATRAKVAGWTAILLGGGFMLFAGVAFVLFPRLILRAFTTDRAVIATGTSLLLVAALFQLFDGVQGVTTGVLRGSGDTRTPMIANLLGHWLLALPVGYLLCFRGGLGVVGLWIGLSLGLIAVAISLLAVWSRRARTLGVGAVGLRRVA